MIDLFSQPAETFSVHKFEKPKESYEYYDAKRFSANCKILFDKMMLGERITSANSPVGDFRRRICDLKENGVQLTFEKVHRGYAVLKEWRMDEADKTFNQKFLFR